MFYKVIDGQLVGRKAVLNGKIALYSYLHHTYIYPVDGWIWAEYENEARSYFNLPLIDITKEQDK